MENKRRKIEWRTYSFLFWVALVLISCNNKDKPQQNPQSYQKSDSKVELANIDKLMIQNDSSSQFYFVSGKMPTKLIGKKGTVLYIVPSDLETEKGLDVSDSIAIELKELHSQKELVMANAQTVSDKKLLETGGAYYLSLSCVGQKLRIKKDKSFKLEFPIISTKKMTLFYGKSDSLGNMNWFDSGKQLSSIKESMTQFKSAAPPRPRMITIRLKTGKVINMYEWEYQQKINNKDKSLNSSKVINRNSRVVYDEEENMFFEKGNKEVNEALYKAVELKNLGWINCDRFYDIKEKTNLVVSYDKKDNIESSVLFLVFKDINSVMKNYFILKNNIYYSEFNNIPVGQKVKLISITVKNNEVFTYHSDLTIKLNKMITVNHKKSNINDINSLFDL